MATEKTGRNSRLPTTWPQKVGNQGYSVKIYKVDRANGYREFKIVYYAEGKRRFKTFADFDEARREAGRVEATFSRGDIQALTLTNTDRLVYLRAVDALKGLAEPLDIAATHYAEAKRQLGPRSLKDAVASYLRGQAETVEKFVPDVVAEFIQTKEQASEGKRAMSEVYLKDLRNRLAKFAHAMQCNISSLGAAEIRAFLTGLGVKGRTWFNYARILRTLFRFAQKQHYYPRSVDPFDGRDGIEVSYHDDSEIEIFTSTELSRLLSAARPKLVPFLALGAFAGLRHAEITRLDWSNIKADHIEVKKGTAKTRSRRIVPIQPNLAKWLAPHRQLAGPVVPFASMANHLIKLTEDTAQEAKEDGTPALPQVDWRHNGLRHSFISYRLAVLKDENVVALESGNSPQMIFASYRELVTEAAAKEWFSIAPQLAGKLTPTPAVLL